MIQFQPSRALSIALSLAFLVVYPVTKLRADSANQSIPSPRYTIRDSGLPHGQIYLIKGFNDACQIAGEAGIIDPDSSQPAFQPFRWSNGKFNILNMLVTRGLSSKGQVLGEADIDGSIHAVIWDNGKRIDRGALGFGGGVYVINDHGVILGTLKVDIDTNSHSAFASTNEDVSIAPKLGTGNVYTYAINNAGAIVYSELLDNGTFNAFLLEKGMARKIGEFFVIGINDNGDINGSTPQGGFVFYHDGIVTSLEQPPVSTDKIWGVDPLNNRGEIVGSIQRQDSKRYAALWRDGRFFDLNHCIVPAGKHDVWVLEDAQAINNRGQIIGNAKHNGKPVIFLMTPTEAALASPHAIPNLHR